MNVDFETSQKLELVVSQSIGNTTTENTLYSVLNHCSTIGGQRRLRSLILQPSTEQTVIEERLECVNELMETPELFYSLKVCNIPIVYKQMFKKMTDVIKY